MADALGVADRALAAALRAGAAQAEATCTIARRFSALARGEVVEKLEQSTERSLRLRVFVGEPGALRSAALGSTDLSRQGIERFAERVVAAARAVAGDPFAGLPETDGAAADDLGIDSADVREKSDEDKLDDVLVLERAARALDPRIDNSNGSMVSDAVSHLGFANSQGMRAGYESTRALRSANPVGRDGKNKRTASYGSAARSWSGCEDSATVARTAAGRVLSMFGARTPTTQKTAVIFERDVAAAVLGDIFSALYGANVATGNSYLIGRIGEKIGSDLVTIVDDGRLSGGLATAPFDAEGVPTRRTVVFENGVLRTYLCDAYYARKLDTGSTASASGPNNFHLEPGEGSLEDLIARTERGVVVLGTIGFATEFASGTYSRGAHGWLVEDGKVVAAVENFSIATRFPELLANINLVGGDLRCDGPVVSPSFRVAEMTISGTSADLRQ